jgi:hypothetical protein
LAGDIFLRINELNPKTAKQSDVLDVIVATLALYVNLFHCIFLEVSAQHLAVIGDITLMPGFIFSEIYQPVVASKEVQLVTIARTRDCP